MQASLGMRDYVSVHQATYSVIPRMPTSDDSWSIESAQLYVHV